MSCCNIYNRSLYSNIDYSTQPSIDLSKLMSLIPAKDDTNNGVWQPIYITPEQSDIKWTEILSSPNLDINTIFNPCNCQPGPIDDYGALVESNALKCDYCLEPKGTGIPPFSGFVIQKVGGTESPKKLIDFCSGVLDSRTKLDDILPKIPKLNQKYIKAFNDFKYLNLFPANSDTGLGFEKIITCKKLKSFSKIDDNFPLIIDWNIKETIGEIPYDPETSQYDSIEDHNKAYNKFLQTGKTCGNFYLTKLNPDAEQYLSPDKDKLKKAIAKYKEDNPADKNLSDSAIIAIIITDGPCYTYLGMNSEEAAAFIANLVSDPLLFENLISDLDYDTAKIEPAPQNDRQNSSWKYSLSSDGEYSNFVYGDDEDPPGIGLNKIVNNRVVVGMGKSIKLSPVTKYNFVFAEIFYKFNSIIFKNDNDEDIIPGDPEWEEIQNYFNILAERYNLKHTGPPIAIPVSDSFILQSAQSAAGITELIGVAVGIGNKNSYTEDEPFPTNAEEANVLSPRYTKSSKNIYRKGLGVATDITKNMRTLLGKVNLKDKTIDFHINIGITIDDGDMVATMPSIKKIIFDVDYGMNLIYKNEALQPVFPKEMTIPYGFKNNTYDNIYIKDTKLGSHWKWEPTSGILCWYRYSDLDNPDQDTRMIRGVDLYISPGDVFHAKNIGPENLNTRNILNNWDCPSGLKLIKNNKIVGIIPDRSEFTYISSNIYPKFLEIYEAIDLVDSFDGTFMKPIEKFHLATTLATAPHYDNIIVDLFKRGSYNNNNDYNTFKQLDLLNRYSSTGTLFQNADGLGYIRTKQDFINTLANKYGAYLWQPANTEYSISTKQNINPQSAMNITFDTVIKKDSNILSNNCRTFINCSSSSNLEKKFSYDQSFSCGGITLKSETNTVGRYDSRCTTNGMETYRAAMTSSLLLNNSFIKEVIYSSGCYILQDNYPRIYDPKTSAKNQVCGKPDNPCGPESSYRLYAGNSNSICIDGIVENNKTTYWCDYPTATMINNSNNLNKGITNRPSGTYYDDTIYFKRSYPCSAFMPHIDQVAFHKQRGIYFNSKNFGTGTVFVQDGSQYSLTSSPMTIKFITKDVGIKIYSISIEKLREPSNEDTYNCRAFPSRDSCKCFSINNIQDYPYKCSNQENYTNSPILYTPNLSCQYSIKSYGGYDRNYLNTIVEAGSTIPNHPPVGSGILSKVDTKINPELPYGCEKSQTMTINNYAQSKWSLSLNGFSTTHADIWAEIIEAVNPFTRTIDFINEDNEDDQKTNPEYKRFATKVQINNISLYSKQKKNIGTSQSINLTLTNPFLNGLLGGEHVLYPRQINSLGYCTGVTSYYRDFTNDGDQLSPVGIKFSSIPRKQILNFAIQKPDSMGSLKRGFFNPAIGIQYDPSGNQSPIRVINSGEEYYIAYDKKLFNDDKYSEGMVLIGDLTTKIKKTLDIVSSFPNHRKIKLYLKIDNTWQEYSIDNIFGFVQDQLYIGEPYLFEYSLNDNVKLVNGPIIPTSAKQNLEFDIKYNPVNTGSFNEFSNYPLINNEKILCRSYNLTYNSIRPYFYIAEKLPTNYSGYFQPNSTDLYLNFDINNLGYVSGSFRPTDQTVTYYDAKDTFFRNPQEFKILSKELSIDFTINEGYFIKTTFTIDQPPKTNLSNSILIDFNGLANNGTDSFVLYQKIDGLKHENDTRLMNPDYKTKWGDVINYDGKIHHELSKYKYNTKYINKYYPKSLYDSFINTIAVNNNTSGLYNYLFKNTKTNTNTIIPYSGLSYVVQHQKYNVGQDNLINTSFSDYQNYLPFIDLNFIPSPGQSSSIRSKLPRDLTLDPSAKYTLCISGVYYNTPKSGLQNYHETDKKFWINLRPENLIKSALTINKEFYSNTLRIDDTPFNLRAIKSKTSLIPSSNCRQTFYPSVNISNETFPDNFFNFSDYTISGFTTDPFARFPVYCDADVIGECDGTPGRSCSIKNIGYVEVSGEYDMLKESTGTINSKIGDTGDIPYIISYDGGLYNIVGNNKLHYIKRFELNPINNLYPLGGCSSESSPRPENGKFSILSEEYQKILSQNSSANHSELVKNTDSLANEMLFRILYGSKQKINLTSIDSSNDDLITYEDLIKYSDPKIEAKDIYKNIPYDLDVNSKSKNRKIEGNISINGILKVGKSVSITIEDTSINITIERNNGKIEAVASLPNGKIKKNLLYPEYTEEKTLRVVQGTLSADQPEGTTISRVGICPQIPSRGAYFTSYGSSTTTITMSGPRCGDDPLFDGPNPMVTTSTSPPPTYSYPPGVTYEVVSETSNITVADGGIGRGVAGYHDNWICAQDEKIITLPDGTKKPRALCSISPVTQAIVSDVIMVPVGQTFETSRCGTCFTFDRQYWFGNYHNKFHNLFGLGSASAETACECEPYEYGYCRENTGCSCPYQYSEFDYSFEYCRHKFTLKGYKRKLTDKLQNPNLIIQDSPAQPCPSLAVGSASDTDCVGPPSNYCDGFVSIDISETCEWVILTQPSVFNIYKITTRNNNAPYEAICSSNLCNISYNNNKLTLTMGSVHECININLRDDCPSITIDTPDNSFTVFDTIDSSCSDCDIESDSIVMTDQNPDWEIITENRTCVLGYFLDGGNLNTEQVQAIGPTWGGYCYDTADIYKATAYGQCGKSAPDSFPWYTYLTPEVTELCGGATFPTFAGGIISVGYPYPNPSVHQIMKQHWENDMQNVYDNIAPCRTDSNLYTEDDTDTVLTNPMRINTSRTYSVDDIVEGIVPGTCNFSFADIIYPGIAIRAGFDNPEQSSVSVSVRVAYYTYQYRRPRNIQDILIGESITTQCNTLSSICGGSTPYLSSKYKTRDCASAPSCYNNSTADCNNTDFCCIAGK